MSPVNVVRLIFSMLLGTLLGVLVGSAIVHQILKGVVR